MKKNKTLKLGSLFSGIGAIEQALNLMNIEHTNVFACDNGELELKLLPVGQQKEYDKLKKIASYRITSEETKRLSTLAKKERKIIEEYALKIRGLSSITDKRRFAYFCSDFGR